MLTINAAGLKHKNEDFKNKLKYFNSSLFTVQETHFNKKGKFKCDNFYLFEAIRKTKQKGGSMIGVHVDLKPVLVKEYSDTFELIVVEIHVEKTSIRVITGYGPQEKWDEDERIPFFEALEVEIVSAELEGKSIIISMDANSKLGPEYIKGDPYSQSPNGKLLADILNRHALTVVNGLPNKCSGLITREKVTVDGVQKSVIDFVIVSSDLVKHVEYLHIDEKRDNVLTKLVKNTKSKTKRTIKVESDHNILETKINISWKSKEKSVIEVFNFKDKSSQVNFFNATNGTNDLIKIFETNKSITVQTRKFLKKINGYIHQSFKKVKIVENCDKQLENLYNIRRHLRNMQDEKSKKSLEEIESKLAEKYSDIMYNKIKEEVKGINCEEGGFNSGSLWKLKKKLSPIHRDPPTAMKDKDGNLLTSDEDIRNEAVKHYKKVFENKPINNKLKEYKKEREFLCEQRLLASAHNTTPLWTLEEVQIAIKNLNMGISQDPYGHPNEIFKSGVAGDGLLKAITILMNKLKTNPAEYPESLNLCNVTSLYKNKGDRNLFDSHRGVFRTTGMRNILDRLIYNDEYQTVDHNLTDCNVGSRRKRNIRDNLFVINAISNSCKQGVDEPCDINVYDVKKCFDSLWLQECINDLYESGLTNDKLCLLYHENKTARIAIKTLSGKTDRFTIYNTVMQGTVWAGLMCTCTMDKLGQQAYNDKHTLYRYKNSVDVPPLQMVDDIIAVSKCGNQVVSTNAAVNTFTKLKKLELSVPKCARIHIGKANKCDKCPTISVNNIEIKESQKEKYLGDFITKYANPKATIQDRKQKGYGILSEIKAILSDIPLGVKRCEIGLTLRQAWFLNGTLFNSEVWYSCNNNNLKDIEVLDHKILRTILGAHSGVPVEMLYLETGALPIPYVITIRRLSYLQTILKRNDCEIVKKIYNAQKNRPCKGDWINIIDNDFEALKLNINEDIIMNMTDREYKKIIKYKVREKAYIDLRSKQKTHKKVKEIQYTSLNKPQDYLCNKKFSRKMCSLLFNLRCSTVKNIRNNFHNLYKNNLKCPVCYMEIDTQQHVLKCGKLVENLNNIQKNELKLVKYNYLFGSTVEQLKILQLYQALLLIREKLLTDDTGVAYQGPHNTGPSN
jgi:hypothetical protein